MKSVWSKEKWVLINVYPNQCRIFALLKTTYFESMMDVAIFKILVFISAHGDKIKRNIFVTVPFTVQPPLDFRILSKIVYQIGIGGIWLICRFSMDFSI